MLRVDGVAQSNCADSVAGAADVGNEGAGWGRRGNAAGASEGVVGALFKFVISDADKVVGAFA